MSEQTPRYDPQTGKPLYPDDNRMKPGAVAAIALVAAAIGLGAGALAFGGGDDDKGADTVITEPGRTEVTVKSTPAETETVTQTETQTVTVQSDDTNTTGGDAP